MIFFLIALISYSLAALLLVSTYLSLKASKLAVNYRGQSYEDAMIMFLAGPGLGLLVLTISALGCALSGVEETWAIFVHWLLFGLLLIPVIIMALAVTGHRYYGYGYSYRTLVTCQDCHFTQVFSTASEDVFDFGHGPPRCQNCESDKPLILKSGRDRFTFDSPSTWLKERRWETCPHPEVKKVYGAVRAYDRSEFA